MRFKAVSGITSIFIIMGVFTASMASATAVTITPADNRTFVVNGTDLNNIAGMDIVFNYDSAAMANPRVTQGSLFSGAPMVTYTNQPGTVRISFVKDYPNTKSGTGTIAEITFDASGKSQGRVSNFSARLFDVGGNIVTPDGTGGGQTPVQYTLPTGGATTTSTSPTSSGSSSTVIGGSVALPTDASSSGEKPRSEPSAAQTDAAPKESVTPSAVKEPENKPVIVASVPPAGKKITIHKSILERFREFQGEKTPKALISLFAAEISPSTRQEPPIAFSDGTSVVKVFVGVSAIGNEAPVFALNGAKMKSLKIEGDDWVVEALPEKGTYAASISVMYGDSRLEIPLTVAPKVSITAGKDGVADEAAFARFLKDRGSATAPRFDLNGDGIRDYIDDYIFTANYLALPTSKGPDETSGNKTPSQ